MREAYSQMSEEERAAFLEYLAVQQDQMAREAVAELPPEQREQLMRDSAMGLLGVDKEAFAARLWPLVLGSLPASDADILRKAFPSGWSGFRELSRRDVLNGLARLSPRERTRLPQVLDDVRMLQLRIASGTAALEQQERIDAARLRRRAAQKGLQLSDSEEEEEQAEDERAQAAAGRGSPAAAGRPGNMVELIGRLRQQLQQQSDPGAPGPARSSSSSSSSSSSGSGSNNGNGASSSSSKNSSISEAGPRYSAADLDAWEARLGARRAAAARDGGDADYATAAARQQPGASTSGRGDAGSSASSAAAAAAAAAAAEALGAGGLAGGGLGGRLGQMMAAYETYGVGGGWEVEASRRQSAEMRNLIRLHQELTELAADAERLTAAAAAAEAAAAAAAAATGLRGRPAAGGSGSWRGVGAATAATAAAAVAMSPRELLAAEGALQRRSEDLAGQLAALLEPGARQRLKDPAARAVVRYMETQMVEADEAAAAGSLAAATAAAAAAPSAASPEAAAAGNSDGGGGGGGSLTVDGPGLARLGQVLVAATNWEAYRAFMGLYAGRHPQLGLGLVMQAAGMSDGDEWWARLPDVPDQASSSSSSGSSSGSSSRALEVDWERVEAVAALDADVLAFLTELEAAGGGGPGGGGGYSEQVFMKWYFHPTLGPRIRSGALLDPAATAGATAGVGLAGGPAAAAAGGGGGGLMDPSALLSRLLGDAGVGLGGGLGAEAFPDMVREAMQEAVAQQQRQEQGPGPGREAEGAGGDAGAGAGAGSRGRGRAGPAWPRRGRT
ncbi:hypothetical protein HYH02_004325 [Chlamydomonas schloesseri]|uniref:Uncharacterized protein n=1 Tax=Chlamydomonas schloesseri TaxID=2026947 RepID=A0A836B8Q1_9CHLO|nr:hypothetical protein HYH02_004325 [Chlamydomonas schloesseri]|eukprot:KAG2451057.1 hypothetical protein HYH02_004325 [Chlamydomonas schloesseri]